MTIITMLGRSYSDISAKKNKVVQIVQIYNAIMLVSKRESIKGSLFA